jgi:predicted secreted Zn-dependent protease
MLTIILIAGAIAQAAGTMQPRPAAPAASSVGAAPAASAAPAVTTGRTLKDLPATTITYYDVSGRTGPAIQNSLKKLLADPASKDIVQLMNWDISTQIVKRTTGTACTINGAKATLNAKVRLPRLAEPAKVPANVLANWNNYVAAIENDVAANLWFLSDRLRGAEQALVGVSCDRAAPVSDAQFAILKTQLEQFKAQRAQASPPTAGSRK